MFWSQLFSHPLVYWLCSGTLDKFLSWRPMTTCNKTHFFFCSLLPITWKLRSGQIPWIRDRLYIIRLHNRKPWCSRSTKLEEISSLELRQIWGLNGQENFHYWSFKKLTTDYGESDLDFVLCWNINGRSLNLGPVFISLLIDIYFNI